MIVDPEHDGGDGDDRGEAAADQDDASLHQRLDVGRIRSDARDDLTGAHPLKVGYREIQDMREEPHPEPIDHSLGEPRQDSILNI